MCGNRRSRLQGKNGGMAVGKTCGDDEQFDLAAWFPSLEYNYVKLKNFRLWETQDSKKLKIVLNFQDCLVVSNFIPTFANEYET